MKEKEKEKLSENRGETKKKKEKKRKNQRRERRKREKQMDKSAFSPKKIYESFLEKKYKTRPWFFNRLERKKNSCCFLFFDFFFLFSPFLQTSYYQREGHKKGFSEKERKKE